MSEDNSKDLKSGEWNLSVSLSEQLEVTSRISAVVIQFYMCMLCFDYLTNPAGTLE